MNRPLFRLFGIPVTIDAWFLLTLVLFYSLSGGGRPGLYTAIGIGVFTLIHELGHALTARSFGATTEIRLTFLMGWASYSAPRPLTRWQTNLISLTGPLSQLTAAFVALFVSRAVLVNQSRAEFELSVDLFTAITWSGIILALLNLLPLWPLDGGHIVGSLFERDRLASFLRWTIAASAVMAVYSLVAGRDDPISSWADEQRSLAFFGSNLEAVVRLIIASPAIAVSSTVFIPLFCGLTAYQTLRAARAGSVFSLTNPASSGAPSPDTMQRVHEAERRGWEHGVPGDFPRGWGPSPWLEAELIRRSGGAHAAISAPLARLAGGGRKWAVDRPDRPQIDDLLWFVPPEAASSAAVAQTRVFHGDAQALIDTAMAAYHQDPAATGFYLVAEGLARRGDADSALQWLSAAVERHPDARRIAMSPQFRPLHGRREFQQLLGAAERAGA